MPVSNAVRIFKNLLYRMKMQYGFTATLTKMDTTTNAFNPQTGVETSNDTDYTIKKVVELSRHEQRDFEYDLAYIAAGKNFTYGAYYDEGKKLLIFEKRQLRNSTDDGFYDIKIEDRVKIDNEDGTAEVYKIMDITRLKANMGYIVGVVHVNQDQE